MANEKEKAAADHAAERRADYARALKEERAGLVSQGKEERVKQVDAELKRLSTEAKPAPKTTREG